MNRREALSRVALLMGGALSAPLVSGVLSGCRAEPGATAEDLTVLTGDRGELVAVLTEHIIPTTDTPGAREVGVPAFIDLLLADWFPEKEREDFLHGLEDVEAGAQSAHGRPFLALEPEQQVALMRTWDEAAYSPQPSPPIDEDVAEESQAGTDAMQRQRQQEIGGDPLAEPPPPDETPGSQPFFRKELTLAGYYTSEVGMTQELQWRPVPGYYDGDVPLSEVGRAWA